MTGRGSLDDLPRPLADRERRGSGRRRLGAVAIAAVVAAIGVGVTTFLANGPFAPVGDVQGAVGTPSAPPTSGVGSPAPDSPAMAPAISPRPVTVPPEPTPSAIPLPADPGTLEGYRSPLPHGRLTLPFGPSPWGSRIVAGEPFHDGIDLATFCGDRIVAAHGGTVLAAGRRFDEVMGWVGDLGPYLDRLERKALWSTLPIMVVIDDGNGYRSMYAHFASIEVRRGDVVKAGQLLGHEGRTGRASGCHLHYGLFSPLETATFGIDPEVVRRMQVPDLQIARVDPLLVLPGHGDPAAPTPPSSPPVSAAGSDDR